MNKSLLVLRALICILLVTVLSLSVFAGCVDKDDDNKSDTTTNTATTTAAGQTDTPVVTTEPSEAELNYPEEVKYTGYTYRVATTGNNLGNIDNFYSTKESGSSGDVISDALYNRAMFLEDLYDIDIEYINDSDLLYSLTTAYGANNDDYDLVIMTARNMMEKSAVNGYLADLNTMPELKLDASYWDKRIQNEYSIQGKLFTLEGDFSIVDELRTNVIVYNYDIYREYNYDDTYGMPFELVDSGKWTFNTLLAMIEGISIDSNGNGMDADDFWGMVSEVNAPYTFYLGSGLKTITNGNDTLSLIFDTDYERAYNIIETCLGLTTNPDIVFANDGKIIPSTDDVWTKASSIFESGDTLFRTTTLSAVTRLRNMTSDYGILPITKYTEEQDGYYCLVSADGHMPFAIPVTAQSHFSKTADITEAMGYFSRWKVTGSLYSAFFEIMTYARICRTQDDIDMLKLVFESKTYDLDYAAAITGLQSKLWSASKADNTAFASEIETIQSLATEKMTEYLENVLSKAQ